MQHNLDQRAVAAGIKNRATVELDPTIVELHACSDQSAAHLTADATFQRGDVGLLNLVLGVHDVLAELAIVRHENQAFGIIIQTAHVENTLVLVSDDVAQSVASLGILHGAQHAFRLVQSERDMIGIHANTGAVHTDFLMFRIDASAQFGNKLAVDFDTSFSNDLFTFATGSESCLSKKLLQTDTFIIVCVRLRGAGICVWHRSPNVAG